MFLNQKSQKSGWESKKEFLNSPPIISFLTFLSHLKKRVTSYIVFLKKNRRVVLN